MSVKEQPLVSIGIPTYNRPQGLRRALESVIKQTYQNLEIIVSDNCSAETETEGRTETEMIVREFMEQDERIQYVRQEENIGLFYNKKFLFEVSHGEYFTWLCDDDERSPEYIEVCMEEFDKPEVSSKLLLVNSFSELKDPVQGKVLAVDQGCTTVGLPVSQRYQNYISSIYKEQAAVGDLIYGVIKSEAIKKAMAVQPNFIPWDHIFLAQLALDGEFYTIPQRLMSSAPGGLSNLTGMSKKEKRQKKIKSQGIEDFLAINKPGWVHIICLRGKIWNSVDLSLLGKLQLIAWSDWYYFKFYFLNKIQKLLD
ncbi:MAG: glycosyltransferase family 2 protein [Symploca sp. SIO1A3]|nr:glycosyltransferase family 2 protein [Symploca sp. SIO1A3]